MKKETKKKRKIKSNKIKRIHGSINENKEKERNKCGKREKKMERKEGVGVEKRENGGRIRKQDYVRKREEGKKVRITRQKTEES